MACPDLEDKVVLISGSSRGIGRAAAIQFAESGARVVVSARSKLACEETCEHIHAMGGQAIPVVADVTELGQIEDLVLTTVKEFGGLDVAFNNAGFLNTATRCDELSEADWDKVINTNLKSVWALMKYEIPELKKRGGGAIVNTSSVAGIGAAPGYSTYAASKAGIIALSKSVALEVADSGIRVNAICPGLVQTEMLESMDPAIQQIIDNGIPLQRRGTAEEVASLAVWLSSDESAYVTGQSLQIDGGACP